MYKKYRKILGILFFVSILCITNYGNSKFLNGYIFAEVNEKGGEIENTQEANLTGRKNNEIVKIDEYGIRSENQKNTLSINCGAPVVQKVKLGENFKPELISLFKDIKGNDIKLKNITECDSSKIGFKWVEATLINGDLKEETFKIPVSVYDPVNTIFNNNDNIALHVKDIGFTEVEVESAIRENRLNELVIQQGQAKAWKVEDGTEAILTVESQNILPKQGQYTATIRATRKDTNKVLEKKINISVLNEFLKDVPLKDGWEVASQNDFISKDGNKISWAPYGHWMINDNSFIKQSYVAPFLIIDDIIIGPNESLNYSLFRYSKHVEFLKNNSENILKKRVIYHDYYIDISQKLLENGAVEISYSVMNSTSVSKKIGMKQVLDLYSIPRTISGQSSEGSIEAINDFKGITNVSATVVPDPITFPNWVVATDLQYIEGFRQFYPLNIQGKGWETGIWYIRGSSNISRKLEENKYVYISWSSNASYMASATMIMKSEGVIVQPGESTEFKQIISNSLIPPSITVDQKSGYINTQGSFDITGTVVDSNNKNYRLYLEMDNNGKTLIPLKDFKDIPLNETQQYKATIDGKIFSKGNHTVSIIAIDEYGSYSKRQKLSLVAEVLNAKAKIQKVKLGDAISNDLKVLFSEVNGSNVKLKNPISIDSSMIGFQLVEATLIDQTMKEIIVKIPVNVYNEKSTVFNDTDNIALDAKDASFELVDVRQSSEDGTLDDIVRQKVNPKAWHMEDGTEIPIELVTNTIKPVFGNYNAIFKATREDSGKSIQKNSRLDVAGELKFKEVPLDLNYKTTKIGEKIQYVDRMKTDWKIEIENTIGANWSLFVSTTPFENQRKEKLKNVLVFKNKEAQDVIINETSQMIQTGNVTYPTIQWEKTAGLLLKMNPDSKIGTYQGEIFWTLSNAP